MRFQQRAQELSRTWGKHTPGRCQGVLNLGAWTGQLGQMMRCSRRASAGGYCLTHADQETRMVSKTVSAILAGERQFGSENFRRRQERDRDAVLTAAASDPELAAILSEQERDMRFGHLVGSRWQISLDSFRYEDQPYHEVVGYGTSFLGRRYAPDTWTDAVIALVDWRREIDSYASAA